MIPNLIKQNSRNIIVVLMDVFNKIFVQIFGDISANVFDMNYYICSSFINDFASRSVLVIASIPLSLKMDNASLLNLSAIKTLYI